MFSQNISRGAVLAIALCGTALAVATRAEPTADVARPPSSAQPAEEALGTEFGATPRSSMRGFLTAVREGDYARAARHLPGFPQQKIAELADTLDYPPLGSPIPQRAGSCENGSVMRRSTSS